MECELYLKILFSIRGKEILSAFLEPKILHKQIVICSANKKHINALCG